MLFKWRASSTSSSSKSFGEAAEERALQFLQQHGLRLVERNYRVAAGPRARAGEVDLIMHDTEGTLVFVEVRARADASHGGAAASVGAAKQRRLIYAAQHFLLKQATPPPCRFDVIAIEGEQIEWLQAAFNAE
ncbi:YraN family protein [Paucibacter sp. KBW04]|uniref:YraN family protein n=1 Tax=Paucibacter sp. KBW04 TaxID=2153361 RepID=UPI000F57C647|nr:YraN family protein [Paucibacter sp. KBW04]RQO55490.1 YraN family protein [Paucibacter sp. KBW04]